ncbi:BQ2448_2194 [Microbotryum intermedium]|uniref:BQ2448_2194 protein n=1 Tax=Microbotryum intermedium TaxID=269621 RepID=A0A238FB96_9BASI|nr:BQ2448_2194 [Microbotryum intermedium]
MSNQENVTLNSSWQDRLDQALSSSGPSYASQLEALVSDLEQHTRAIQQSSDPSSLQASPRIDTPFDDPFPPLLHLAPLLALPADSSNAQLARRAIYLFASNSSAREVVVALEERVAQIGEASQDQVHDEDSESEELVAVPSLQHSQLREIVALVEIYAHVLPRIMTVKPARFLETATDSVTSIVTIYCTSRPVSSPDAAVLARMVAGFIETSITRTGWSDAQQQEVSKAPSLSTSKSSSAIRPISLLGLNHQCHPLLQSLLFSTAFTLTPFLPISLAETYFFSQFPNRRILHRERPHLDLLVQQAWSSLILCVRSNFEISLGQLFGLATSTRGAFELFVHVLAGDPQNRKWVTMLVEETSTSSSSSTKETATTTYSRLLRKTLGPLIAITREGSSGQGRDDEALFWLWWCVQGASEAHEMMDEEVLFPLVEIISTHTSLSPSPSTRFIAFSLLSTLILDLVSSETTQIFILKDLIETCPFPSLQSASIGILRRVLLGKFEEVDGIKEEEKGGLWLSPLLLIEFKDLFKLQPLAADESREGDGDEAKTVQEQLSLLYLLLSRDEGDRTGIWKGFARVEKRLLEPLRRKVGGSSTDVEDGFRWSMLEVGLERIDSVVKGRDERRNR